mgnify:CR=1 FL=1
MHSHIDRRGTACILKLQIRDEDLTYVVFSASLIVTADVMDHERDFPHIPSEIEHDMPGTKEQCSRPHFGKAGITLRRG